MAGTLFDWKGDQKQYRDRDNFRMCPQGGAISKWWEAREALWKRQWGSGSSPSLAPSFFSFFPLPTSLSAPVQFILQLHVIPFSLPRTELKQAPHCNVKLI